MEFYPAGVPVPQGKRTSCLRLRPLRVTDVELDYKAVMSSAEMLHRWSQSDWPTDDFTLAQNLADLQRHEREHIEARANSAVQRCCLRRRCRILGSHVRVDQRSRPALVSHRARLVPSRVGL